MFIPFAWELSLGYFAWELSLEAFRFEPSLGNFTFGSFVWKLWPGIFRLIYSAWDVSLGGLSFTSLRLGTFAGILRDLLLAISL